MRAIAGWIVLVVLGSWLYDNAVVLLSGTSIDLSSLFLGVFGAAVIMMVFYRFIHNRIVEADRRNDIAGVNKKHDARRI